MMSKELSRQLCELCGIKPKKVKKCRAGECCIDFPCCEGRWGDSSCYIEQTIDFTKPENFVRLLKIANDVLGGVHFATAYTKNKPHIFEEQALVHYLPIAKLNNSFQRAIREAEWVYE